MSPRIRNPKKYLPLPAKPIQCWLMIASGTSYMLFNVLWLYLLQHFDFYPRRAYDRNLLHRSSAPSYSTRAPPHSGPRATHAWEHSSRRRHSGFGQAPPDYTYTPPPHRSRGPSASASQHYSPPRSHHDARRGTRKDEEFRLQADQIQNTSSLVRAAQVLAALAVSVSMIGGMRGD